LLTDSPQRLRAWPVLLPQKGDPMGLGTKAKFT
jgi:hypothetical protein